MAAVGEFRLPLHKGNILYTIVIVLKSKFECKDCWNATNIQPVR